MKQLHININLTQVRGFASGLMLFVLGCCMGIVRVRKQQDPLGAHLTLTKKMIIQQQYAYQVHKAVTNISKWCCHPVRNTRPGETSVYNIHCTAMSQHPRVEVG
jgi:hypothetical protein